MSKTIMYNKGFFERIQTRSRNSAQVLVPVVMELTQPASVIDVGCGIGEFVKVFLERGIDDVLGIDGKYVDRSQLVIPQEYFRGCNLNKPFSINRTYDLAISLEVGEHLVPESAPGFVDSLTRLAPIILFSAAVPLQGGYLHINEQWPDYWSHLFKARGYVPVDALRKRIWHNRQVADYYRQNALFFCTEEALAGNSVLAQESRLTNQTMLSIVHPDLYLRKCKTPPLEVMRYMKNASRKMLRR